MYFTRAPLVKFSFQLSARQWPPTKRSHGDSLLRPAPAGNLQVDFCPYFPAYTASFSCTLSHKFWLLLQPSSASLAQGNHSARPGLHSHLPSSGEHPCPRARPHFVCFHSPEDLSPELGLETVMACILSSFMFVNYRLNCVFSTPKFIC